MEKRVKVSGVDHSNGFLLGSHTLVNEVAGNLKSSLSCSLAVTCLEHIKLAVLNGELHILHIAVVLFKCGANLCELLESLGELLLHLVDVHRRTNACNNVLALCVCKELAEQTLCARCGIACERNACAAVVAHVSERHGLYVYGSTPAVWDIVVAAVNVSAGVVP